ncbi:hypothetical protein ACFTWH_11810 [Streptomyces sp. NPDC057011]|uniref:hypothetical protein n=1 Tax=unclassified Streptomyces TaxID=2593676 RepID=UPI00362FB42B
MSAQPIHPHEPDRVPRNADGIAAALDGTLTAPGGGASLTRVQLYCTARRAR